MGVDSQLLKRLLLWPFRLIDCRCAVRLLLSACRYLFFGYRNALPGNPEPLLGQGIVACLQPVGTAFGKGRGRGN